MDAFTISRIFFQVSAGISAFIAGWFTLTCPCTKLGSCHLFVILPSLIYSLAVVVISNLF
jgi:hypothetical protein